MGVYVDAFNLYYGGKSLCAGSNDWKWLDIRSLVADLVSQRRNWSGATVERVVYCTARPGETTGTRARQQAYFSALKASGSVDEIVEGHYSVKASTALVTRGPRDPRPLNATADPLPDADWVRLTNRNELMVRYRKKEEKGSDVNIASHMLIDVYEARVDAVVVVSNDSDLGYPVEHLRQRVPVGVVNPRGNYTVLLGDAEEGVGRHWWARLTCEHIRAHQMPDTVGGHTRPPEWR